MSKIPLVTVAWASHYRLNALRETVERFMEKTNYNNIEYLVVDSSVGEKGKDVRDWVDSKKFIRPIYDEVRTGRCHKFNMITNNAKGEFIVEFEDDILVGKHVNNNWLNKIIEKIINFKETVFYSLAYPEYDTPILSGCIMRKSWRLKSKRLPSTINGGFKNVVYETEKCQKTFLRNFFITPGTRNNKRIDVIFTGSDVIRINPTHPSVNFSEYMRTKVGYVNRRAKQTLKLMNEMEALSEKYIYWHGVYQGDKEYSEMKLSEWEKPRWDAHHKDTNSVILGVRDE